MIPLIKYLLIFFSFSLRISILQLCGEELHFKFFQPSMSLNEMVPIPMVHEFCDDSLNSVLKVSTPIPNLIVSEDQVLGKNSIDNSNDFFLCLKEGSHQLKLSAFGFRDTSAFIDYILPGQDNQQRLHVGCKEMNRYTRLIFVKSNYTSGITNLDDQYFWSGPGICKVIPKDDIEHTIRVIEPETRFALLDSSIKFSELFENVFLNVDSNKQKIVVTFDVRPFSLTNYKIFYKKTRDTAYTKIKLNSLKYSFKIGRYDIKISADGYYDHEETYDLVKDTTLLINLTKKEKSDIPIAFGFQSRIFAFYVSKDTVKKYENYIANFLKSYCEKPKILIKKKENDIVKLTSRADSLYKMGANLDCNYLLLILMSAQFKNTFSDTVANVDTSGSKADSTLRFDFALFDVKKKKKEAKVVVLKNDIFSQKAKLDSVLNVIGDKIINKHNRILNYAGIFASSGVVLYIIMDSLTNESKHEKLPAAPGLP